MSILTHYREKLHLKNVANEKHLQGQGAAGVFTGLKRVGVLLDATSKDVHQPALKFIKGLKKEAGNVKVLAYLDVKEVVQKLPFDYFCKKDLDWIWRPKSEVAPEFKQQKFDLLINLCQNECYPLEYLAVGLKANYKIGALTDYPNDYNLMLDSKNLQKYIEQVYFFLNKFRNKK